MLEELGEHRRAFVGLFVATFVAMLGLGILAPILPMYANAIGASGLVLGIIFSGFAVSRGAFAPFAGRFSDAYGRKRLLMAGLVGYAVLSVAYAQVASPVTLGLVRFFQGFASVLVTPIAQSYVGDITPRGREGAITNLFYVSLFGGIAIGPTLGGYLAGHYSIRAPFYAIGGLTVVATAMVYFLVPALPAEVRETHAVPGFREAIRAVWADLELRGINTYIAARGFYRWGFNTFFPVFAAATLGLSATSIGVVLSAYMAMGAILQIPLGRLADRFVGYRTHFIVLGGFASAIAMAAVPFARSLPAVLALVVGMGISSAVSRSSAVAIRTERGRVHGMGLVTGAFTASLSLGQVFGPIGFGEITDVFSITDAFLVGGVVGFVGTVATLYFLYRGARQADDAVAEVVEAGTSADHLD